MILQTRTLAACSFFLYKKTTKYINHERHHRDVEPCRITDYKKILHNYKRLFGAMEKAIISTNSYIFRHWRGNLLLYSDLPFSSQSSQLSKDSEWMCKYPLWCPHNKILFCKETEVCQLKYYHRNKFLQPVTTT